MTKEDILLIDDMLNDKEVEAEKVAELKTKVGLIVKQISLQEELNKVMEELNAPKGE